MTKIPSSLKVGPYIYKIIIDTLELLNYADPGESLYGATDHSSQRVLISPDMGPDITAETLMHEFLHAAWHLAGLGTELDEAEEQVVKNLSPWILMVLRDNPDVVKYWQGISI